MKENRRHNFCEEEELCMYVNRRMCVCVFINRMVRPNRMLEKVKVNNNLAYLCIRTHPSVSETFYKTIFVFLAITLGEPWLLLPFQP